MYVWRLPLLSFAFLVSTVFVLTLLVAMLWLRARTPAPAVRGIVSSVVIVAPFMAPVLMHILTRGPLARAAAKGMYIDPSSAWGFLSAALAIVLIGLAHFIFPISDQPVTTAKYRAYFVCLIIVLGILNLANWCAPGWCERFGFPFPYAWWSDAIIVMNGENLTAGLSSTAIVLDLLVAAGATYALAVSYRRTIKRT